MSQDSFKGKNILVTGGSNGIGFSLVQKLLIEGANVLVCSRSIGKLENLFSRYPETLSHLPADLSQQADLEQLRVNLYEQVSHLDYVVLNAGNCEYVDANALEIDSFRRVMEINFFAAVSCFELCLPLLKKAPSRPLVLGVGSLSTVLPFTRAQAYGASKCAFSYFLESLRIDMHDTLDVSVIHPGFVETELTSQNDFPMPFIQQADEAAEHIMGVMQSRKLKAAFPFIFSKLLSLLSVFPALWFFLSKKMLSRAQAS